jgi:UDP-3-O-[3-hydroxymyristoyl] glucosamine N-acyltransferase
MSGIELPRTYALQELARSFGGSADEAASRSIIDRIAAVHEASREEDLVPLLSSRYLADAERCPGILLCLPELAQRLAPGRRWIHAQAMWVLSELLRPFESPRAESEVAEDAVIGAQAIVLRGAHIGAGCRIEPGAVIYGNVSLGQRVTVGANSVIGRPGFGWTTAPDGRICRVAQLGGVVVEDDVEIGALCTIDAGTLAPTRLGRGVKLDAQVHVAHNVEIGAGTIVAAQTGFGGSARIGSGVLIGGQVGITDHALVGDRARIGAKSGVIGDIPEGAIVAGFPAVPRWRWLRAVAASMRSAAHGRRR